MNEKVPAEMQKQMRRAGMKISVMMALVMSLALSIIGNLSARRPEGTPVISIIIGIISSFIISFVVSMIIGFVVPTEKINAFFCQKLDLQKGKLETRLFESLISDLIYTPFMTLAMTGLAYITAMKQSGGRAQITYSTMFLGSLSVCMIAGLILIFIFQPLFVKMFIPQAGEKNEEPK